MIQSASPEQPVNSQLFPSCREHKQMGVAHCFVFLASGHTTARLPSHALDITGATFGLKQPGLAHTQPPSLHSGLLNALTSPSTLLWRSPRPSKTPLWIQYKRCSFWVCTQVGGQAGGCGPTTSQSGATIPSAQLLRRFPCTGLSSAADGKKCSLAHPHTGPWVKLKTLVPAGAGPLQLKSRCCGPTFQVWQMKIQQRSKSHLLDCLSLLEAAPKSFRCWALGIRKARSPDVTV